ncbi:MAG: MerR family transcriptional regulator [Rhodospirillales bacterium]|nr:MAG: MerR family transcriptional regulator [Rhodospirillales bacterium]
MAAESFTARQAASITGYKTAMMLDYLCRTGIVIPSIQARPGHGNKRRYSFGDLVLLKAVRRLLDTGLKVSRLKKSLDTYRKKFNRMKIETVIEKYMVSDGVHVWFEENKEKLFELTDNGQMAFAFDMRQTQKEIASKVEQLRTQKAA